MMICNNCIHSTVCKDYEYSLHDIDECEDFEKPNNGRWIEVKQGEYHCSKCNWCDTRIDYRMRYCPNCGAYMKKQINELEEETDV